MCISAEEASECGCRASTLLRRSIDLIDPPRRAVAVADEAADRGFPPPSEEEAAVDDDDEVDDDGKKGKRVRFCEDSRQWS